MTQEQGLLFALFAAILGLLLSGRVRHDLVAAGGMLIAVTLGLVHYEEAFSGFSNHAVVIVALVLIASRAFENSGALTLLSRLMAGNSRSTALHITVAGGLGATLSAFVNNVAALALLMPVDMQAARKAGRPPGVTLMPLAFATILGGMVTLIGTPPNLVASAVRQQQLGEPYRMFDFLPVGLAVAVAGLVFVALIGWRLVPRREDEAAKLMREASFKSELLVPETSSAVGRVVADLDEAAERADVLVLSLMRGKETYYARARSMPIAPEDVLVVEGSTDSIAAFIKAAGLQEVVEPEEQAEPTVDASRDEGKETKPKEKKEEPQVVEAVVRSDSRLIGYSASTMNLRRRHGVTLLGMTRAGVVARTNVAARIVHAGDVLLLTGRGASSPATLEQIGVIAVSLASVAPVRTRNVVLTIGLFAAAVAVASMGWLPFTISIAIAVAAYGALGLVPAKEFYQQIDWSVVVMLACLLPIGAAFERVGGTALIAESIANWTQGYAPVVALVAVMVVTMTLSDALNNVATMVITGPIAIGLAQKLGVNPDTFLMGVAVSASCAFLTPIGHKNNTLIMGPGAFRFSDYWRMGLPLEIVVLVVAVPALLAAWPL
jgi:di/tricarboxylate transporter